MMSISMLGRVSAMVSVVLNHIEGIVTVTLMRRKY